MLLKYDDYPEQCPPASAVPIEGVFYRLCDTNPPTRLDFLTHVDRQLPFPKKMLCSAMALSFYSTTEKLNKLKKKPRFKNSHIVEVKLEKSHGISTLSNEHLNLWELRTVDLYDEFYGVKEGESDAAE